MYIGHAKYSYSCQILVILKFSGHIFEKYSNNKLHEDLSSGSRVIPWGRTDGQPNTTKLKVALTFRHSASCTQGQAFPYSPEKAIYIFTQQIYFII